MTAEVKTKKKFGRKQRIVIEAILAVLIAGAGVYFYYSRYYPSTDDAYVNTNIAYVSPQVTGKVLDVMVANHQQVKAGDVLFKIDPAPFIASLNQAKANLSVAEATLIADQDQVKVNQANLTQAESQLVLTQKKTKRTLDLLPQGYVSHNEADQAVANLKSAKATFSGDQAALIQARQNVTTQQSQIKAAKAQVETAELHLSYTTVSTPTAGVVSNLTLRPGMVVTTGQELFAVVDQAGFWIDANFEETKLKRIREGQSATVTLDMYPGVTFHGVVQSLSAANGSTFSLLPPENATGNWVKVTQRFPVKISIPDSELTKAHPLRVGASATVTIDTKS